MDGETHEPAEPVGTAPEFVLDDLRLVALDIAIGEHPQAAVNYLLRGELLLDQGCESLAEADFERAVALIEERLRVNDWDSVGQVLLSRAEAGLAKAALKQAAE